MSKKSKKTVPDSSREEGNTLTTSSPLKEKKGQIPPRKNHFFTYFLNDNIDSSDSSYFTNIVLELKQFAYKGKFQTEVCPTSGRVHIQGSIWCKQKHRDTEFKLLKGAHFETLKDTDDVSNYCNKEETFNGVFRTCWGYPEPRYIEEIPELYEWEHDIIKLVNTSPDKRSIYWYWEEQGCAGKTTFQKYLFSHFVGVIVLSGKAADMKNAIITYESTNKSLPKIILVNIPRSSFDYVSYTGLEEIKDMFFHSGKYEGGMVCGPPPHVLVFANEPPDLSKMTDNRFIIKNLRETETNDDLTGSCLVQGEASCVV